MELAAPAQNKREVFGARGASPNSCKYIGESLIGASSDVGVKRQVNHTHPCGVIEELIHGRADPVDECLPRLFVSLCLFSADAELVVKRFVLFVGQIAELEFC